MSAVSPTAPASVGAMYRALVGVGLGCGLLIVLVFQWTLPIIQHNQAEALQRAIFDVLPEARSSATFAWSEAGRFTRVDGDAADAPVLYAGYGEDGELVGLAFEAEGMGYADVIRVLYGYSVAQQAVVGIRVLESRETPGLGDRIETDPQFLANFERLDVSLADDGQSVANPIESVKPGEKEHAWQVDAISGATISSVAIADMLSRSTAWWMPRVQRATDDFRAAAAEAGR